MRKFACLWTVLLFLATAVSMVFVTPVSVEAIGEVTPTPVPEEDNTPQDIDADELLDEALSSIQNGDYIEAVATMDVLIEADSSIAFAYVLRGFAFTQLGDLDEAVNDFSRAIELEPWQFDYYMFRGDAYFLDGEFTDALDDYDSAIFVNPWSSDSYFRRAEAQYELENDDAGDVDDLISRAVSSLTLGDMDTAIGFLDEAIDIDDELPNVASAYYLRGSLHLQNGDTDEAVEDYTNALEINPEMHNALLGRGIIYREDGDLEAAGEDFYNRITILGLETIEQEMEIGDTIEIEMAYRRVVAIVFEGEAGQEVTISASELGGAATDPLIALVDPDGNPIAGDDDFGGGLDSEIDNFELPESGTYTLWVSHAEGGYDFGFSGLIEVEVND